MRERRQNPHPLLEVLRALTVSAKVVSWRFRARACWCTLLVKSVTKAREDVLLAQGGQAAGPRTNLLLPESLQDVAGEVPPGPVHGLCQDQRAHLLRVLHAVCRHCDAEGCSRHLLIQVLVRVEVKRLHTWQQQQRSCSCHQHGPRPQHAASQAPPAPLASTAPGGATGDNAQHNGYSALR